ncbi:MAG: hypothetical protein ACOYN0_05035 [Phycisphaerales bacterium]
MKYRRCAWFVLAAALFAPGCVDQAPAYRQELLTADERLEGAWTFNAPERGTEGDKSVEVSVIVSKREAIVTGGKLGQFNGAGANPTKSKVPAYSFTIDVPKEAVEPELHLAYDGVLLRIAGTTFLAFEPSPKEKVAGDYLPVHRVVRVERDGDTLTCSMLKAQLVWIASIRIPYDTSEVPPLPTEQGQWIVQNPEHMTELLGRAVGKPELWDKPMVLRRRP